MLRALWTQSPATYEGQHYHVRQAYCEPRPATPIPILVGGRRPKFMRVAAAKADIWQWDGPIERYQVPYDLLVEACAEIGRDRTEIRLSCAGEAYFPSDPADFPEPTMSITDPAQDPSGAFADEFDWVLGPTPDDAIRELQPLRRPRRRPVHHLLPRPAVGRPVRSRGHPGVPLIDIVRRPKAIERPREGSPHGSSVDVVEPARLDPVKGDRGDVVEVEALRLGHGPVLLAEVEIGHRRVVGVERGEQAGRTHRPRMDAPAGSGIGWR